MPNVNSPLLFHFFRIFLGSYKPSFNIEAAEKGDILTMGFNPSTKKLTYVRKGKLVSLITIEKAVCNNIIALNEDGSCNNRKKTIYGSVQLPYCHTL